MENREWAGQLLLLSAWIVVPLLAEILPAFRCFILMHRLSKRKLVREKRHTPWPLVTLVIPVYREEDSLLPCLESVYYGSYPRERLELFLVDNGRKDLRQTVYESCRRRFPKLSFQWMKSPAGKANALNLAMRTACGTYIIHLDSDGVLDEHALCRMVERFEENPKLQCVSGAVLVRPDRLDEPSGRFTRVLRRLEFLEYGQTFLAGRKSEAVRKKIYTISGAFSGFRKSALQSGVFYDTRTVCEDTYITFAMRQRYPDGVGFCESAFFFIDPVEDLDKLYTQRQRWQRGELEMANLFLQKKLRRLLRGLFDFRVRLLILDHTFAFPRLLWTALLCCLPAFGYSLELLAKAGLALYLLYVSTAGLLFGGCLRLLRGDPKLHKAYRRQAGYLFLMPFYSLLLFFFRFAGIIHAMTERGSWNCRTLSEEFRAASNTIRSDFSGLLKLYRKIGQWIVKK